MIIPFVLECHSKVPKHIQLREQIISAIDRGHLKPGQRMPSSRILACELGLSRIVVVQCYEALAAMSYLQSATGTGTFVTTRKMGLQAFPISADETSIAYGEQKASQFANALRSSSYIDTGSVDLEELNFGAPIPQNLPLKQWRTIYRSILKDQDINLDYDSHPFGNLDLRGSIRDYVQRARGVNCSLSQVAVFSSSQQSLSLLFRVILDKKDRVVVENPGFGHARKLLESSGAEIVPVGLDEEGLRIDQLCNLETPPKVVYVTPSHHDPSGVVMTLNRRKQLLAWANEHNVVIIEDDYDSEFRYGGNTLPAIQSLDSNGLVIYLANFWKVLFPLSTLGFLILPKSLLMHVAQAKSSADRIMPYLEQKILTKMLATGALECHILKTKQIYAALRRELIYSMSCNFGKRVRIAKETSGMHLMFHLESALLDHSVVKAARDSGLGLVSMASYYFSKPVQGQFLISFSGLMKGELAPRVALFASLINEAESALLADGAECRENSEADKGFLSAINEQVNCTVFPPSESFYSAGS